MMNNTKSLREIRESVGSDDFSTLLGATLNKRLQKAYNFRQGAWERYCDVVEVNDFKDQTIIELTELDDLEKILESGEYKQWTFSESSQTYRVYKYGKRLDVPWEWIRNDDLRSINKVTTSMGRAARRTVDKFAVTLLEGTTASTTVTGVLNEANLELAINELESRTDATTGELLGLIAAKLVIPTKLQFTADRILHSGLIIVGGNTDVSKGDKNALQNRLEPVVDPFLTSQTNWYVTCDPADVAGIEVAFLKGYRSGPYFGKKKTDSQEELDFDTDGYAYKMRHVFGGARVDSNAIVRVVVST
jgi:hypothetical protein